MKDEATHSVLSIRVIDMFTFSIVAPRINKGSVSLSYG